MRHAIDPKIDCVFKALLGSEENRNLLIHFLNAFLAGELVEPLVWVDILNPYNDKECLNDKLSIVDVKAKDSHGRLYQIEIQLKRYGHLADRIMYNWADIYSQQLKSGQSYSELRPTYAIWLLAENLVAGDGKYVHHYKMRDEDGQTFAEHGGIWLLELDKFNAKRIESEEQRWLQFFKEGERLNDESLPDWMVTQEMKQAMSTLSLFSEKERQYHQYQARQEYLREQQSIQTELEQKAKKLELAAKELDMTTKELDMTTKELDMTTKELDITTKELDQATKELQQVKLREEEAHKREELAFQEKDLALQEKDLALQEKQAALAEIEHLKALLAKKG